jgi:membrane-associated PAP2 superfamily phosphatase
MVNILWGDFTSVENLLLNSQWIHLILPMKSWFFFKFLFIRRFLLKLIKINFPSHPMHLRGTESFSHLIYKSSNLKFLKKEKKFLILLLNSNSQNVKIRQKLKINKKIILGIFRRNFCNKHLINFACCCHHGHSIIKIRS